MEAPANIEYREVQPRTFDVLRAQNGSGGGDHAAVFSSEWWGPEQDLRARSATGDIEKSMRKLGECLEVRSRHRPSVQVTGGGFQAAYNPAVPGLPNVSADFHGGCEDL